MKPSDEWVAAINQFRRRVSIDLDDMEVWQASVDQFRDACMAGRIIALNLPSVSEAFWFKNDELDDTVLKVFSAVTSGRLIDCGHLPNEMIKIGGKRGGAMYNHGLLAHPFREPWLLFHSWEEGVSGYLIELLDDNPAGGRTRIIELNSMQLRNEKLLCAGDVVMLDFSIDTESRSERYTGGSRPATWRIAFPQMSDGIDPMRAAMNNCLDPFVAALLLLHTDGVSVDRIEPPAKLNRARLRNRKQPLPARLRINSEPYVTALLARKRRRTQPQGGHHASPIPHVRLGHWRYFKDGQQPRTALRVEGERAPWRIRISDALVNVKDEARAAFMRSHYAIRRTMADTPP